MTVTVTHAFVSSVPDDPASAAAGDVLPQSHWNAQHVVTGVRTLLTSNTTYYVSTTGSDSNPGTSGSPWATPQHAADWIGANIDAASFAISVQMADGTYVGPQINSVPLNSNNGYFWLGHNGDNTKVIFNDTGESGFSCFDVNVSTTNINVEFISFVLTLANAGDVGVSMETAYTTMSCNSCKWDGTVSGGGSDAIGMYSDNQIFTMSGTASVITGAWQDLANISQAYQHFRGSPSIAMSGTPSFSSALYFINQASPFWELSPISSISGAYSGSYLTASQPGFYRTNLESDAGANGYSVTCQGVLDETGFIAEQISGTPTTSNLNQGAAGFFKDTTGGGVYVAYNDAGTIKKVALT